MTSLDVRTVITGHFFTTVICTVMLAFVWIQNRKHFFGAGWWFADFAFQATAAALVVQRGSLPDWLSMTVSNTLIVAGALLGYIGLSHFIGKSPPQIHNYVFLAGFAAVHNYFVYVQPDLSARNLNLSMGLLFMCAQCAWLIFYQARPEMLKITRGTGWVFVIFCIINIVNILSTVTSHSLNNDFFQSGWLDTVVIMIYQFLSILLVFSIINMANLRLLSDIRFQENKYSSAFRSSPYAITLIRLSDGKILDANEGFLKLTGYTRQEIFNKTNIDLPLWVREKDREEVVQELIEGRSIFGKEYLFRKKSGEVMIGNLSAEVITVRDTPWILANIQDITQRKEAERNMLISGERFRELVQSAPDAILGVEQNGVIQFSNPAASHLFGYHLEELIGAPVDRLIPLQFNSEDPMELEISIARPQIRRLELVAHHKSGQEIPVDINLGYIHIDKGIQVVAFIRDISEQRKMQVELQVANQSLTARIAEVEKLQNELREQVIRDSLTGLYNRRHLQDVLRREFSRAEREKYTISIIMLDMDELKKINDSFGHRAGDQALQYLANYMQRMVRLEDLACRLGGDEFTVILSRANPKDAVRRVNEWRDYLSAHPMELENGEKFTIRFSAGVASYPIHATTMDEVVSYADVALYRAKARGRNCTIEYT